jgi:hypothetical protein
MPEVPALVELTWLALLFLSLAFVIAARQIVTAFFHPLLTLIPHLPGVGDWIASQLHALEQSILNGLGVAEHAIDSAVGASFHALARQLDWLWDELKKHANLVVLLAGLLLGTIFDLKALKHATNAVTRGASNIFKAVKALERTYHGIEGRVKSLEQDWSKGIGHDLRIQVRALEGEVGSIEHTVMPAIQADVGAIPADLADVRAWVDQNFVSLTKRGLIAAVVTALGYLGLSGLRCSSLTNMLSKRACGMWSDLEGLLGLFADAIILTHLCDLPKWINEIFGPVEGFVVDLISSAAVAACAAPNPAWDTFDVVVPNTTLPPSQALGTLP